MDSFKLPQLEQLKNPYLTLGGIVASIILTSCSAKSQEDPFVQIPVPTNIT
jgi:hypothetical protein